MKWKNIKIARKLIIVFLSIGLFAVAVLGYMSYNQSKKALIEKSFDQLQAIRDIKKNQIESFFKERKGDLNVYAYNTAVQLASQRFIHAFDSAGLSGELWKKWDRAHGVKFEHYVREYGYYDLFIISNEGDVVYTVAKEGDLGKNLVRGSLANSPLGEAFQKGKSKLSIVDFQWYDVSSEPASFVAGPIKANDGSQIGVLAYQISLKAVNSIMQERSGMGETGETYLVGSDKKMRSDSYLDPEGHSVQASFEGTVKDNGVDTEASREAISGKTDRRIVIDYNGNPVLSAYTTVDLGDFHWALMAEIDEAEIMQPVNALGIQIFIVGAILALIIIVVSVFFSRSISKPLEMGVNFAKQMAEGDLTAEIKLNQNDEIGMLAQALVNMRNKLSMVVENVQSGANNIASASEQLSSTSQEMSQGSSEQASSAEEVSSSMEQMASNIQQNTDNAHQTEKISQKASKDISEGNDAVGKTVVSMRNIADKIGIISEIARQTNILALNAAVEAARAGEHGKGFAVVAEEVRKLAARSQEAALEIDETSKSSVDIAEQSGKILTEIVPDIERTAKLVQEIAAASNEQSSGAAQVNNAIQQLNQVTQQNAAAAEEMATSAEELSSQAESLQEAMAFFRIKARKTIKSARKTVNHGQQTKVSGQNSTKVKDPQGVELKMGDSDNEFENF
jgi:methyl-accepting chemotaxis protein